VRAAALLMLAGLLTVGCGIAVPATTGAGAPSAQTAPPPSSPHQNPTSPFAAPARAPRPASHQPNPYNSPLAAEALVAFANEYINWNSHNVASVMRLLASQSIGQAHAEMELAAGETARDYELHRGGIANSGQVEGVAPCGGPGGRWVIVTREKTTATASNAYQGLAPAWHVIVGKAVELRPGRWAISLWQPES
jgi:hypothetical protein